MSKQTKFKSYSVLGVEIDALTIEEATNYLVDFATSPASRACYVVKPYVEFLDRAHDNTEFKAILNQAELSLPDGVALNWASYYLYDGKRTWFRLLTTLGQIILKPTAVNSILPARFAGIDATWKLLEACEQRSAKVFLVGSPIGSTIEKTAKTIQEKLPNLPIVGTYAGVLSSFFGEELVEALKSSSPENAPEKDLIKAIKASSPDVILIGIGSPQQEFLAAKLAEQLEHGVLIGEGGSFDYKSFGGNRSRAPKLFRTLGLEWLWRLLLEPSRIRRQLAIPRFIWRVYKEGRR